VIAAHIDAMAATAAPALGYINEACRAVAGWLRQTACGATGHEMVRRFEPQRMSLQCLSCGAETAGWLLDQEPDEPAARRRSGAPALKPFPRAGSVAASQAY
jgi:hypothetical protein